MLHRKYRQKEELFKQRMLPFAAYLTFFFLAHLSCMGAESTASSKENKRVSFSSHSGDSSNSPTSSNKSFSSSGSSPISEEATMAYVKPQSHGNEPASSPKKEKRSRLKRTVSFSKASKATKNPTKFDQRLPFIPKEKELSLTNLLTEETTVAYETDEKKEIEKKVDKKKEIAEEILSSFMDERAIFVTLINLEGAAFQKLKGTYTPTFTLSLRELVFQKFHGRVENLRLRLAEYDEQTRSISTFPPLMETKSSQSTNYSELIYPPEQKTETNFSWSLSDVNNLALALYIRDFATFQDIDPGDMIRNLISQDCPSKKAIITLTKNFNATADLWALQILMEQNEEKRKKLITNITFLGRLLYMTHNYHGASQVNACFAKKSVSCLWEKNPALNPLTLDSNWPTIKGVMTPRENYKSYREQLVQNQDDPRYLPDFTVILHDLQNSFEVFGQEPHKGLHGLAISLEPLLRLKMISSPNDFSSLIKEQTGNPFLKHICGLSEEHILDALSRLTMKS
jgi:hypothetical protein